MDLDKYKELTGIDVPAGQVTLVTAQIRRTQRMLETMLGFTLDPSKANTNLYNELGKSPLECACPDVDTENLLPPDDVVGAYRLFTYNELDQYFWIDPFKTINKVKLVFIRQGSGDQGVTIKTFDEDDIRVHQDRNDFKKYLEHCISCFCECTCSDCVQLAVDADWLWTDGIPEDLLYIWSDMVTYYSDPRYGVKSETIDTHSYTKFDRIVPETEPYNFSVIKKYAGPNGSATVMPTNGAQGRR